MAPRKAAEKPRVALEPRKGVKKKTPTVKSIGAKLKTMPTADLLIPDGDNVDSEIVPKKISKRKLPNKININGIKPMKACKVNTEESFTPMGGPPKNKKASVVNKQNHDDQDNQATDEVRNPDNVYPKNKRAKAYKQTQNYMRIDDNKAIEEAINLEHVPKKVNNVKVRKVKNQNKNEIKIMVVDEVFDESNNPEESPSKAKRMKATDKQKQKKIQVIITKEDDVRANTVEIRKEDKDIPKVKRRKACKQNNNEIKIMLANEVIRSAFEKKPKFVKNLNRPVLTARTGGIKRPGRHCRNKTVFKPDNNAQNADNNVQDVDNNVQNPNNELTTLMDCHERIEDVAKKKPVKYAHCRKKSTLAPSKEDPQQLPNVSNPSPQVESKKRRVLSLKRQTKPVIDQASENTVTEDKEETKESTSVDNNKTLFNSNESTAPDSASKIACGTQSPNPNNVICRRNSGNSTSTCFSWTKDISSSSTITCVTVKSSDFVRIDKRLPIVKLTNFDHILKRQNSVDSIFDENSCDTPFNEETKCPSECSSVSMTNLNVNQTLNLSTSSMTSVTSNRISENNRAGKEKKDERITKLEQSLENLFRKMKNFDLEIINWIGYSNENQDSKIEKSHARILEVLNYENDVIRYCKEINRVLVRDKQTTETSNEFANEMKPAHSLQAVESLVDNNSSRNDILNLEEQDKNVLETNSESKKDTEAKNIPDHDEELNDSKSFDKNIDFPDNDDDDALSLFAESITGLESSRKNSSFAVSVTNDNSVISSDLDISLPKNRRVIKPITHFEEKSASCEIVNNVKKQTADSSTAVNVVSDSGKQLYSKYKIDKRTSVPVNNSFSDTRKVEGLDVSCNNYQNTSKAVENNDLDRSLISDMQSRSLIDASESRSDDFETFRVRTIPSSLDDDNLNFPEDVSGIPVSTSENWNNKTRLVQENANTKSIGDSDNSNLVISVEQMRQSAAIQLAMASEKIHLVTSSIFKGICLFNLVMSCKNMICNFPHMHIDVDFVRSKLQDMSEEQFLKESMFLLKWHCLKWKYGMCFVEECIRRNMTIWLLHLVKEFISKRKKNRDEEAFDTTVSEATLLHLNDADMQSSADLLRSKIRGNFCMCDHLMKAISETQNFSRFKSIFIKLTLFMCHNGRSFKLDVATQLVERLCILPYDDALARALMKVIAKTNPSIFNVPMMVLLESQLSKNNAQLYKDLIDLKHLAERYSQNVVVASPTQSPRVASSNAYQTSTPIARADSPDTTNTDFVNNTTEPVITRTITINRTINTSNLNTSTGSESSEERARFEPRRPHTWRGYAPSLMSLRPQRQVYKRGFAPRGYAGGLPKFLRRPPQHPY